MKICLPQKWDLSATVLYEVIHEYRCQKFIMVLVKHVEFTVLYDNYSPHPKASLLVVGFARAHDPESYGGSSLLLVGFPMPDRSKVMTQTKRDALALQVGGQ
jgi:hypothetical protein